MNKTIIIKHTSAGEGSEELERAAQTLASDCNVIGMPLSLSHSLSLSLSIYIYIYMIYLFIYIYVCVCVYVCMYIMSQGAEGRMAVSEQDLAMTVT